MCPHGRMRFPLYIQPPAATQPLHNGVFFTPSPAGVDNKDHAGHSSNISLQLGSSWISPEGSSTKLPFWVAVLFNETWLQFVQVVL